MARQTNRQTLFLGKRARYEGRVRDGDRHGLGTLFIDERCDDDDEPAESALRVTWIRDMPHGRGCLTEPDGGRTSGCWHDGELRGLVREEYADGSLRYLGQYAQGERAGEGIQVGADGGCLVGTWADGALHGPRCAYLYPDATEGLALVGEWRRGRLHRARQVSTMCDDGRPLPPPPPPPTSHLRTPAAATHPALGRLLALCGHGGGGALDAALRELHGRREARGAHAPEYRCGEGAVLTAGAQHGADAMRRACRGLELLMLLCA